MAARVLGKVALSIVCACGFAFSALLLFHAVGPWVEPKAIPFFHSRPLGAMLLGMAGLFCAFVTVQLIYGRRWAWWLAFGVSTLILGLGVFLFYSSLHPLNEFECSESGFGIGISVLLMLSTRQQCFAVASFGETKVLPS